MQTEQIGIRRAQLEDALEMARLACELGYPMTSEEMGRRMGRILGDTRHYVVVATTGAESLLGWMHVEYRVSLEGGERAELMGLIVDGSARRRHIGRELVDVAENWTLAKGLRELTVRSNAARELSHPFYEALGYARAKTQHVYTRILALGGADP